MNPEFDLLRELNFAEAVNLLEPAAVFAVGVAIYAVLIFNLYRFMSRRDIFNLDFSRYEESGHPYLRKSIHLFFYICKYLLIFPLFAFFWFGVLVVMVAFLSKTKEVEDLLLIAMAVLMSVRVTSYYTEDLSRDIAKMLPFALLGIFLIDLRYFDFNTSTDLLNRVGAEWKSIFYYWVFIVLLEFVLRITEPYFKALYNAIKNPRRRTPVEPEPGHDAGPEPEPGAADDESEARHPRVRPAPLRTGGRLTPNGTGWRQSNTENAGCPSTPRRSLHTRHGKMPFRFPRDSRSSSTRRRSRRRDERCNRRPSSPCKAPPPAVRCGSRR